MNNNKLDLDTLFDDNAQIDGVSYESSNKGETKKWQNGVTLFRFVPFHANSDISDPNSSTNLTWHAKLDLHYAKDAEGQIIDTFVCPKSYGKSCPSCQHGWEMYNGLKKTNKQKEKEELWKKFLPSQSYVYYGFDRSREEEFINQGWFEFEPVKFSKTTHDSMLLLKDDPEVGNFFHVANGIDIKVTYSAEAAKERKNSISVKEGKNRSPILSMKYLTSSRIDENGNCILSEADKKLIKNLMEESYKRMNPLNNIFSILSEDKIIDILEKMNTNNRLATEVTFDDKKSKSKLMKAAAESTGMDWDDNDVPF